jgi:hypothetical protein
VVTGAGDETLRFWEVFPGNKKFGVSKGIDTLLNNNNNNNNNNQNQSQDYSRVQRDAPDTTPDEGRSIRLKKDISILDSLR